MEEQRTVFISSCSRRQMARRRPQHSALRAQLTLALAVAAAIVLVLALRGSL
jgi:hypothetical protein